MMFIIAHYLCSLEAQVPKEDMQLLVTSDYQADGGLLSRNFEFAIKSIFHTTFFVSRTAIT